MSGLPGIGKTSSAVIVCCELGFTTCELNASDCRSKRSLQEEVSQTLGMQNLKQMACGQASKLSRDRHVLIMDEVDGMAGNEDRGGMQELINMIKSSRIPVINNTQMWCVARLADESQLANDAAGAKKDVRLGAFDVIRKVFSPDVIGQHGRAATVNECLDLFFQDYSIVPLFVQENYLNVKPKSAQGNPNRNLRLLAEASKNIALGDVVSNAIRSAGTGSWSLLPTQGILSTVIPGHILCGNLPGGVGPNGGDTDRVLQTLIQYNLQREDLDALLEFTTWSNRPNRMQGIDGKAKAALTRAFNKSTHLLPYSTVAMGKLRSKKPGATDSDLGGIDPSEEDADGLFDQATPESSGEEDELQTDTMISRKAPKPRGNSSSSSKTTESANPSTSKRSQASTRGRGTGKGSRKKSD
ncbi:unnamed protein product [Echinostoma caproni]|uniref:AAA domain-containing protein n=1 Tax=Echinostoma caproni TaxID=27848 RepID=A0A3P8KZH4_9TREM|nr:unnamed protein product [Echinostoma caproni]